MSAHRALTIAVTGLNATDNPGPGVAVLRSLRAGAPRGERLVGLSYDALDPGVYTSGLCQRRLPAAYPSSGTEAYLARLRAIQESARSTSSSPRSTRSCRRSSRSSRELHALGIRCFSRRASSSIRAPRRTSSRSDGALRFACRRTAIVSSADRAWTRARGRAVSVLRQGRRSTARTLATCLEEALAAFHKRRRAPGAAR